MKGSAALTLAMRPVITLMMDEGEARELLEELLDWSEEPLRQLASIVQQGLWAAAEMRGRTISDRMEM